MRRCAALARAAAAWQACPAQPHGAFPSLVAAQQLVSLRLFGAAAAAAPPAAPPARPPGGGAVILDGREPAAAWLDELAADVAAVRAAAGRPPGLGVVLVGDRPDSALYVERKREACARAGVAARVTRLPAGASQAALEAALRALCADDALDGVLLQLPLPAGLDEDAALEACDPEKDVDGLHPLNMGRVLMRGRAARFVPAAARGVLELLRRHGVSVAGAAAVVVGDSNVVGAPLAALLRDRGAATVTVVHRAFYGDVVGHQAGRADADADGWFGEPPGPEARAAAGACAPPLPGPHPGGRAAAGAAAPLQHQQHQHQQQQQSQPPAAADLRAIARSADVLVVAVGCPRLVRADWVRPGAVVIDVGINVLDWGGARGGGGGGGGEGPGPGPGGGAPAEAPQLTVVGDVDLESVAAVAGAVTPVPGGVGPMTIAALLHNTVLAARRRCGLAPK